MARDLSGQSRRSEARLRGPNVARRFFVALGAGRYRHLPNESQLPNVDADVERMGSLFETFGYRRALTGLGSYTTSEHVKRSLSHWCRDEDIGGDDIVVIYYAGHGVVDDRHYLLCWDSDDSNLAASALATEDLVRVATRTGLRNFLLILDTCYAGAGGAQAAQVALTTLTRRLAGDTAASGMWFMSSARDIDRAGDGTFTAALSNAITVVATRTGQRQQFLDLHDVVGSINDVFRQEARSQRAELSCGLSSAVAPFIPHTSYRVDLPPEGTDLEFQRTVGRRDLVEHFGPRARGVDFESEQGMYFSGRNVALSGLARWLATPGGDGQGRVVTGKPGCGKSAVVGRMVALSDRTYRHGLDLDSAEPDTIVAAGTVDVAVHARHKRLEDLVTRIAAGLGLKVDGTGDLLLEISRRARAGIKTVIVVDALDEAGSGTAADSGGRGEPRRIARELLRPLSDIQGVHLLVGSRRELVRSLGHAMRIIDLDEPTLIGQDDIADYVERVLVAAAEPDIPTPYRTRPGEARLIARAVAERAAGVFLVARMTARSLRLASMPVDLSRPGWRERLPSEIGEAFDDYLARFGSDEQRVRRMLLPLAFAEGQGLPHRLWPQLATASSGAECTADDVEWTLNAAGSYIAEVVEQERSVYRLYHQTLAEHLRADPRRSASRLQETITDALIAGVPHAMPGTPDWFAAHPYVRTNLATHAAAAGRLGRLATDPGFLLAAEPLALLSAMSSDASEAVRQARATYEQVAHRMTGGPAGQRAAYLQLSAHRCLAPDLAIGVEALDLAQAWTTRWASWSRTGAHRRLLGHQAAIESLAVGELDGRPIAVSGDVRGCAHLWDLTVQRPIGTPLVNDPDGGNEITAVALVDVDDYSLALLGSLDGTIRVCDLSTGREHRPPLRGHANAVLSIAVGRVEGRTVAVTGSKDGSARVWDLHDWCEVGSPFTGHLATVWSVAITELDGVQVAVTAGADRLVRIWDLASQQEYGEPLVGHSDVVRSVAVGLLEGRVVVLTGSEDQTIQLWDLTGRRPIGERTKAHQAYVYTVAIAMIDGRAIGLSGGYDGPVRLWDLASRQQLDQPLMGHTDPVHAIAVGAIGSRSVALTAGDDRIVRIWDLRSDQPSSGHLRRVSSMHIDTNKSGSCRLVTGSADGTARLWELPNRAEVGQPMAGHGGGVTAVTIGNVLTGSVVVTGDEHGVIRVWDPATPHPAGQEIGRHTNRVTALIVTSDSQDRTALLWSGSADGSVRQWNLATRTGAGPTLVGHQDDVDSLAAGVVDGRPVAVAASKAGRVSIWDLQTGQPLLLRAGWDPYGGVIAVACIDGRAIALRYEAGHILRGWEVLGHKPVTPRMIGHTDSIVSGAIVQVAGSFLAITGSHDGSVRAWDLLAGRMIGRPLLGHQRWADVVTIGECDSRLVAATSYETYFNPVPTARLWDVASTSSIDEPFIGHDPAATTVTITSHDGVVCIAAGNPDGDIVLRDVVDGSRVAPNLVGHRGPVSSVRAAVTPQGRQILISGSWDQSLRVWDADTTEQIDQFALESHTLWVVPDYSLAVAERDGRLIAICGSSAPNLTVWDLESHTLLAELVGHTARTDAIAVIDHHGLLLGATGSNDATARLWNLDSFEPYGSPLGGHDGGVAAVAFVRFDDRPVVVTGDEEGVLRCWEIDGERPADITLEPHPSRISCLAAGTIADRNVLCSASRDGLIRIWNLSTMSCVVELNIETAVREMAIAGNRLLCVGTASGLAAFEIRI